ncbi:hypothetical protein ACIRO1_36430 [Streptomyces sp. NPDC102381]|uniref:hypothetical protein n=1 Tax=Streptomyces sp. NPDC102381 TaxID=3366164 RepID=UPI0037FC2741
MGPERKPAAKMRLLPWTSELGKPCYLRTNDDDGVLAMLANGIEDAQLCTAKTELRSAEAVLANPLSSYGDMKYAVLRLTEVLGDALRIADSRWLRLEDARMSDDAEEPGDDPEGPTLPAEAFG